MAALALLLAAPFGIATLETNSITGPAMRSFETTSLGQVVKSFSADAQAISRAQQADKAAGQASFFCYAWQCRRYVRMTAKYSGTTLKTTWHLYYPKRIRWHLECKSWVNMSIDVNAKGSVVSRLMNCA